VEAMTARQRAANQNRIENVRARKSGPIELEENQQKENGFAAADIFFRCFTPHIYFLLSSFEKRQKVKVISLTRRTIQPDYPF
jgi:hypothetical protein